MRRNSEANSACSLCLSILPALLWWYIESVIFTKDSKVVQAYQSIIFPVFFIFQLDELLCVVISQSTDAKVTEEIVPSN